MSSITGYLKFVMAVNLKALKFNVCLVPQATPIFNVAKCFDMYLSIKLIIPLDLPAIHIETTNNQYSPSIKHITKIRTGAACSIVPLRK